MSSLYSDIEAALLCDYFNIQRPRHLVFKDVFKGSDEGCLLMSLDLPEIELANAVGRIALNGHSMMDGGQGDSIGFRRMNGEHEALIPRHLFSIRWPGDCGEEDWIESYFMTFFPDFDRYVVTACQSPNNSLDFEEVAIGWRNSGSPRLEIAEDIVTHSWRELHGMIIGSAWQTVERAGLVSEDVACMWRNHVWRLLLN